jgi:hypothetical protein
MHSLCVICVVCVASLRSAATQGLDSAVNLDIAPSTGICRFVTYYAAKECIRKRSVHCVFELRTAFLNFALRF